MATTRIFVRSLPPSVSEDDFKAHFAKRYNVTDVKLLGHRRIGYVGFKTAEDALAAVKYFNKSFMRMSRIGVELADVSKPRPAVSHPTSRAEIPKPALLPSTTTTNILKRKLQDSSITADVSSNKAPKLLSTPSAQGVERSEAAFPPASAELHDGSVLVDKVAEETGEAVRETSDDVPGPLSDQDWIRSRTSRLLGLVDDEEELERGDDHEDTNEPVPKLKDPDDDGLFPDEPDPPAVQQPTPPPEEGNVSAPLEADQEDDVERNENEVAIRQSSRLFLRNLPYSATEDDISNLFEPFGALSEVHLSIDPRSGDPKGFAFVMFANSEDAVTAFKTLDGSNFQGRLLHILPGATKRETKLDDYAISQLPLKKQKQIQRKADASSSTFRWNSMYMNADAVLSSISDRLGVQKSELLDPSSSDAAVKQAQAETHVIQETKTFFQSNGIDLDAFKSKERSDTAILIKNFAYGTTQEELKQMFSQHGDVSRFLMPPSGTIAIVEFQQARQARTAFAALSYRKLRDSVLFLEKAPKNLFNSKMVSTPAKSIPGVESDPSKPSTSELLDGNNDGPMVTSTLFVRNLNFITTNERFRETFAPLEGLVSARIKTKTDAKKPGQLLSMGFGFLEFRTNDQAKAALAAMDGYMLDDHRLTIRASHKGHDAAEERRNADQERKRKAKTSKLIIKNLPFEASKKDIRTLFKSYGQLRAVRVPKKFDNSRKGYAFAEFSTSREAESAMEALRDTHFLGRRLVLEYASGEAEDPENEIAKMQQKIGRQTNNVALQKLTTASARRKFVAGDDEMIIDD